MKLLSKKTGTKQLADISGKMILWSDEINSHQYLIFEWSTKLDSRSLFFSRFSKLNSTNYTTFASYQFFPLKVIMVWSLRDFYNCSGNNTVRKCYTFCEHWFTSLQILFCLNYGQWKICTLSLKVKERVWGNEGSGQGKHI